MRLLYPLFPYMENKHSDVDYWLQMTKEQVRKLSLLPFVHIGSHGYYHNDLARIGTNEATEEMVLSKQYLENIIDQPVNSLAFPYGTYTRDVVEAAKNTGYDQLLCMGFQFKDDHTDPVMKERFAINPFINTTNQMHATITRKYEQ